MVDSPEVGRNRNGNFLNAPVTPKPPPKAVKEDDRMEETILILNGYAKVLRQLARELPKHGVDKSFQETLKGIGSKLLYIGVSSSFTPIK